MRVQVQGIVIDSKKVAESDVIITILTPDKGKLRLYANGARYLKSKLSTATRLFVSGSFDIFMKKELHKLISVEVSDYRNKIVEDLDKFFLGNYILEFVQKAIPAESADEQSYLFLQQVLDRLDSLQDRGKLKLFKSMFDAKMLRILGYQISILQCVRCGNTQGLIPSLSVSEGGVLCKNCCLTDDEQNIKIGIEGIKLLNLLLNNTFDYIQTLKINDIIHNEVDVFLYQFIREHILTFELRSMKSLEGIL